MKDTQIEFRIRAYCNTELAQLYCPTQTPGVAYRKLRQWIALNPGLTASLETPGSGKSRTWTPAEVKDIIEALGEP